VRKAIAAAERDFSPIDILINNSGVGGQKRLAEVEEEDYDQVMDTNARGAFFVAQAVARSLVARRAPGRIVNIASAAGLRPMSQIGIYSASKAAFIHMTRAMALEWGRHGINVNAICPGYIETDINREYWATEAGKKLVNMLPRKRVGKPEDLDGLVLLLASEHSHFINGAVIAADDGLSAG
jgi:NAD(P)-dependent dehydrogenase (short-subunit alcohol dehydrogenase family)